MENARIVLEQKGTPNEERLKHSEFVENEAKIVRDGGYHLVFAHSSVSLWSALESMVLNFCKSMLCHHPELADKERLEKIRIPSSVVLQSDKKVLAAAILAEFERNTAAPLKLGMGRFSECLSACGLNIAVSDQGRRSLLELSKVRNLVVHQFSICDEKFASECPWFDAQIGHRISLNEQHFSRYRLSVQELVGQIQKKYSEVIQVTPNTSV